MTEGSETKESPKPIQRVSSYSFAVIFITIVLSLAALGIAIASYNGELNLENNIFPIVFLIIGFIGLASSTYMLMQTRRRVMRVSLEIPAVMTTITCQKCDFKNVREFERGDYVFKQAGPCPKCNNTLLISAIYREVKEKPKKDVF
jgi:hypothetical protein